MKISSFLCFGTLVFLSVLHLSSSTMLLTSMLMALKSGMLIGKMSVGGLLMMLLSGGNLGKRSIGPITGSGTSTSFTSRRYKRSASQKKKLEKDSDEENEERDDTKVASEKLFTQQLNVLDPINCLPKVLCGLNTKAAPPSGKTSFLNDYQYLMKTIFSRDEDDEIDDDDDDKDKTKKSSKVTSKKNKDDREDDENEDRDDDSESEEDPEIVPKNDKEFDMMAVKEKEKFDELLEDEMVNDNPEDLKFILMDMKKRHPGMASFQSDPDRPQSLWGTIGGMVKPQSSGGDIDDEFKKDPFFADLPFKKRQLVLPAIVESPKYEVIKSRRKRRSYLVRKRRELTDTNNVVERMLIGEEVGQMLRSPRQCRALFRQCPFQFDEIITMIGNLRKVIGGQEVTSGADQIYNLKVKPDKNQITGNKAGGSKNVINIQTKGQQMQNGVTKISHQLGDGGKVEILLKLNGKNTGTIFTSPQMRPTPEQILKFMNVPATNETIDNLNATLFAIEKFNELQNQKTVTTFEEDEPEDFVPVVTDIFKDSDLSAPKYFPTTKPSKAPVKYKVSKGKPKDKDKDKLKPLTPTLSPNPEMDAILKGMKEVDESDSEEDDEDDDKAYRLTQYSPYDNPHIRNQAPGNPNMRNPSSGSQMPRDPHSPLNSNNGYGNFGGGNFGSGSFQSPEGTQKPSFLASLIPLRFRPQQQNQQAGPGGPPFNQAGAGGSPFNRPLSIGPYGTKNQGGYGSNSNANSYGSPNLRTPPERQSPHYTPYTYYGQERQDPENKDTKKKGTTVKATTVKAIKATTTKAIKATKAPTHVHKGKGRIQTFKKYSINRGRPKPKKENKGRKGLKGKSSNRRKPKANDSPLKSIDLNATSTTIQPPTTTQMSKDEASVIVPGLA